MNKEDPKTIIENDVTIKLILIDNLTNTLQLCPYPLQATLEETSVKLWKSLAEKNNYGNMS